MAGIDTDGILRLLSVRSNCNVIVGGTTKIETLTINFVTFLGVSTIPAEKNLDKSFLQLHGIGSLSDKVR